MNHAKKKKILEACGNKCVCGQGNVWQGKPLTLHIHGHKTENPIVLCPNCHTQTDDYGWKALTHEQRSKGGSKKGRVFPLEHRKAISKALRGRKASEETKQKQSQALIKYNRETGRSATHRLKLSQAAKARCDRGDWPPKRQAATPHADVLHMKDCCSAD